MEYGKFRLQKWDWDIRRRSKMRNGSHAHYFCRGCRFSIIRAFLLAAALPPKARKEELAEKA